MTTAEALKRIEQMQLELALLRSIISPPKKKPARTKPDFTKQIQKHLFKSK